VSECIDDQMHNFICDLVNSSLMLMIKKDTFGFLNKIS